jgi:hypothetical protein
MRKIVLPALLALLVLDVVFSAYASSVPKNICHQMQSNGFVKDCQEGTPWAFEVVRHEAQWKFYTTNPELFGCYHLAIEGTGRIVKAERCHFEGAITQFASVRDLDDAVVQINNAHHYRNTDQYADLVRADTTLEYSTVYTFSKYRILILMPRTENGIAVQNEIEKILGPSD